MKNIIVNGNVKKFIFYKFYKVKKFIFYKFYKVKKFIFYKRVINIYILSTLF